MKPAEDGLEESDHPSIFMALLIRGSFHFGNSDQIALRRKTRSETRRKKASPLAQSDALSNYEDIPFDICSSRI
jgi:hypothetical protein